MLKYITNTKDKTTQINTTEEHLRQILRLAPKFSCKKICTADRKRDKSLMVLESGCRECARSGWLKEKYETVMRKKFKQIWGKISNRDEINYQTEPPQWQGGRRLEYSYQHREIYKTNMEKNAKEVALPNLMRTIVGMWST